MAAHPPVAEVTLDAHESRGLASTILIARQLLDHDGLDAEQQGAVRDSLARAATALAHHVVTAEPRPAEVDTVGAA